MKKIIFLLCLVCISFSFAGGNQKGSKGQGPQGGEPPKEAIAACKNKNKDETCKMSTPRGELSGTCKYTPDEKYFACMPANHPQNR